MLFVKIEKARYETLWYASHIGLELDAVIYDKDARFYEIPQEDDSISAFEHFLVYKDDVVIVE